LSRLHGEKTIGEKITAEFAWSGSDFYAASRFKKKVRKFQIKLQTITGDGSDIPFRMGGVPAHSH